MKKALFSVVFLSVLFCSISAFAYHPIQIGEIVIRKGFPDRPLLVTHTYGFHLEVRTILPQTVPVEEAPVTVLSPNEEEFLDPQERVANLVGVTTVQEVVRAELVRTERGVEVVERRTSPQRLITTVVLQQSLFVL